MDKQFEALYRTGVVPVVNVEDPETAVPLAEALQAGGLPLIEVTLRSDASLQSIQNIRKALPGVTVIAGTVRSVEAAEEARAAGAEALVAPGFQEKTVLHCVEAGVPILPGCVTPTEIQTALDMGLRTLKFFPAERSGGVDAIQDLSGPFPEARFVPTGGVRMERLPAYFACGSVAAVGGSFMANADLIAARNWEQITANARRCVALSLGFELAHVGLNQENREAALAVAEELARRFPLGVKVGTGKSSFLGTAVEVMHAPYCGTCGHIAFRTNSVERARAFFQGRGLAVREDTIEYDKKGRMRCFYLREEVGGFALHVVGK